MKNLLDLAKTYIDGAWHWLIGQSSGMSRRALGWGGLALAAIILLSVNLFSWATFRGLDVDMTEDRLYTISPGTKQILQNIDEPISARLYFSRKLGEVAPSYAGYYDRVRALLERYRDLSGGKFQVTVLDPEPFSEAEDRAVAAGLRGIRLNAEGEVGYLGLTATNSTDNEEYIPLLSPDRESYLEYDVTKMVYALANPKKRVVGLMTALPLDGGTLPPNMAMGQQAQPSPPWLIMDQIREFFEVRKIEQDADDIPQGIDVLMVAQPMELTPQGAYAIDQYALKGGKVLFFIDPVAESAQMTIMSKGVKGRIELAKLLKNWGVAFNAKEVAADIKNARRVQFGGRGAQQGMVTDFVGWLALTSEAMNQNDVLSNGIESLHIASAGVLTKTKESSVDFAPIIQTSSEAMKISTRKVGLGADPVGLLKDYKPGGKPLTITARLSGEVKSAFPNGRPFEEDNLVDSTSDGTSTSDNNAAATDAKTSNEKKAPKPTAEALKGHIASGRINAIVIGDSDILADRFWARTQQIMGQDAIIPTTNNASFVVGALENLAGNDALIALRGRGVRERPFTLVDEIRREAERKFREKEDTLTKKLKEIQNDLAKLEKTSEDRATIVTEQEQETISKFRTEMLKTRRELRNVQLALRHDIDNLDAWLKFANIALVPILLGFAGLAWSIWQHRKQKTN